MRLLISIFFLSLELISKAQVSFQTIAPTQSVVAGEPFQVQYTISNADKASGFTAPLFPAFKFVNGPEIYSGTTPGENGDVSIKNYVYRLTATRPGRFEIPGAIITVNGKQVRSNNVLVTVLSQKEAAAEIQPGQTAANDQVLLPGEDPYEKIRQNLFVKVMVDRRSCYVGEPVLATFKLYSRLESKSDIVKNPGFYGFTVYDMVNLADQKSGTETINGKIFEVHTVRQVQLYPLQAGLFTIDAMEVKNEVAFSKSVVNKKTEQEITEGTPAANEPKKENVYESSISTEPVTIQVKAAPLKNKPAQFSGACGDFMITAVTSTNQLAKNEQGFFDIIISGKGNFIQLDAPSIHWPAGIEGFEPSTKDSLNKNEAPLQGKRTFRYPFISPGSGNYELPSVSFSFFNPASASYKTISTVPVKFMVSNEEKKQALVTEKKASIDNVNDKASKTAFIIILSLILLGLGYWILQKKKPEPVQEKNIVQPPSAAEVLQEAEQNSSLPAKEFCSILSASLWSYFRDRFTLQGTAMNKEALYRLLLEKGIAEKDIDKLRSIFSQCEAAAFTSAELETDKERLLMDGKEIIETVNKALL